MVDFAFRDSRLETLFALHFAAQVSAEWNTKSPPDEGSGHVLNTWRNGHGQGRKLAAAGLATTMVLHCLALLKCLSLLVDGGSTPRLALLTVVVALASTAHAWTLSIVMRPSEVCSSRLPLKIILLWRRTCTEVSTTPVEPLVC